MKIVVGIVTYNTSIVSLQKLLGDLMNERGIEIVVLCNNSDSVYQKRIIEMEGITQVIISENKGFGAGHNKIFNATHPDWYVCCNPDAIYRVGVIPGLINAVSAIKTPGLVSPLVWDPNTNRELPIRPYLSLVEFFGKNFFALETKKGKEVIPGVFQIEFTSGCFFMIKGNLFDELGGFDDSFFLYVEDADLSIRAGKKYPNLQVPSFVIEHDGKRASRRSFRMALIHIESLLRYTIKHRKIF